MPWWAWLAVDLFLVAAALTVIAVTGFRFYRSFRAFLGRLRGLELPKVERPG